jgi:hypothetical protein
MPLMVAVSRACRRASLQGVPLNELVEWEVRLGDALFRGIRLSEPRRHLAELTGLPLRSLAHRSGLPAEVLVSGPIVLGDPVLPA